MRKTARNDALTDFGKILQQVLLVRKSFPDQGYPRPLLSGCGEILVGSRVCARQRVWNAEAQDRGRARNI